jgi:hypothetical protein
VAWQDSRAGTIWPWHSVLAHEPRPHSLPAAGHPGAVRGCRHMPPGRHPGLWRELRRAMRPGGEPHDTGKRLVKDVHVRRRRPAECHGPARLQSWHVPFKRIEFVDAVRTFRHGNEMRQNVLRSKGRLHSRKAFLSYMWLTLAPGAACNLTATLPASLQNVDCTLGGLLLANETCNVTCAAEYLPSAQIGISYYECAPDGESSFMANAPTLDCRQGTLELRIETRPAVPAYPGDRYVFCNTSLHLSCPPHAIATSSSLPASRCQRCAHVRGRGVHAGRHLAPVPVVHRPVCAWARTGLRVKHVLVRQQRGLRRAAVTCLQSPYVPRRDRRVGG